eukprot:GEZU01017572.1.p1 GENE.GEZU01017572.1~~GEZU01017572.1.p1  ORF type:complete len:305 (-),score=77.84 GEZU01017572.1:252-1115(-)
MSSQHDGKAFPAQVQEHQPGKEHQMTPRPIYRREPSGSKKLKDKVAIITGGDSGIGRACAVLFAQEGANVAIVYLDEDKDAEETKAMVEKEGGKCLCIKGDLQSSAFCEEAVKKTVDQFGRLDVLVNNAAVQYVQKSILDITDEQLEKTFRTNIFAYFYMARAALRYMKEGSAIINSTSVTAYRGKKELLDYSSTKGAIVAFTRSLSSQLAEKNIRVNAVAPGPIWTPLIPASFPKEKVEQFGSHAPLGRAGQPAEVAPCYLFLACEDSSYVSGQVLHPNGGELING